MKAKKYPTQEEIKKLFNYNPETGIFTWKPRSKEHLAWNGKHAGKVAGSTTSRYVIIYIRRKPFRAHRLAWIYVYGDILFGDLDHENREKKDNRISNLRLATRSQNMRNYLLSKNNISGVRGISWNKQFFRWEAYIEINKESIHLGVFKDFDDAVKARYEAEIKYNFVDFNPKSTAYQYLQEA